MMHRNLVLLNELVLALIFELITDWWATFACAWNIPVMDIGLDVGGTTHPFCCTTDEALEHLGDPTVGKL